MLSWSAEKFLELWFLHEVHSLNWNQSTGSNLDDAILCEENSIKGHEWGDVKGDFPSHVSQDSDHLREQMQPFTS